MSENINPLSYCENILIRKRFPTNEITIGILKMGAENPIRVQSMTTVDTLDTAGSVEQSLKLINAGCELIRLTAPSKKEAENLGKIKRILNVQNHFVPLVADIHFTPNAAEIAARLIEKVRVNPGNYADKKKFEEIEYTDETYLSELIRIEEKFTPLVLLCKEKSTAIRIGTNHGSLSDRILSRFGDTPEGMVESAMEFIRICKKHDFNDIVISMKASNTLIMVQAYRLLVATMKMEGMNYPLHLGVTEAGDGEDGRIKSAVGIGTLLEDGLGDTLRVSLTEDPELEIPVAQKLIQKYTKLENNFDLSLIKIEKLPYNPFQYNKHKTIDIEHIGSKNVPVVIADLTSKTELKPANLFAFGYNYAVNLDKYNLSDQAVDFAYLGNLKPNFELPGSLKLISEYHHWKKYYSTVNNIYPIIDLNSISEFSNSSKPFFVRIKAEENDIVILQHYSLAIIVLETEYANKTQLFRNFRINLSKLNILNPVILHIEKNDIDPEMFQLSVSAELGGSLIDGFGDGIWITSNQSDALINSTAFGILQATRTRISKTEYISCPSCGRTLFDLQETTQKIRERTSHLKGIKIGIMGCIVNGPGEMADADYGYVGTGPGKINLYKEKNVMQKNVSEKEAVDALINLIKENGDWIEPKN
ncbi:MAG: (E)-4-hydroxy-3-methylbut-2-enyl-diphosphate synthase [Flavobacteriia bacterium]|nr:(E)-4-hydroxy-3-methylbut-2-enyl-diphosphate synthase [Flavobacteriia bacterium]